MWILDGAMGTELAARGVATPAPGWSMHALVDAPDVVAAIHADYARAGAEIHRANTFRVQPRITADYRGLAKRACELARSGAGKGRPSAARVRIAGSMAPIEDCYRPDLSPPPDVARREHAAVAQALADAGVDMIVCETFPHAGEAAIAVREAAKTRLEVWVALTAGPNASLLTPAAMHDAARACVGEGAAAVLVCCVAASKTLAFVERLAAVGVPYGAYANAGASEEELGWGADPSVAAARYADFASTWIDAGATLVGACCGTGPAHVAELARRFSGG